MSPEVIKILSPKSYWYGINYVNLIVISSYLIFIYSFFTTYLMYHKKTARIAINTIISAVLNIVMNYFLIIKFKSIGAAYATIISYAILFALHFVAIQKEERKNFAFLDMIISVIAICVWMHFLFDKRFMASQIYHFEYNWDFDVDTNKKIHKGEITNACVYSNRSIYDIRGSKLCY